MRRETTWLTLQPQDHEIFKLADANNGLEQMGVPLSVQIPRRPEPPHFWPYKGDSLHPPALLPPGVKHELPNQSPALWNLDASTYVECKGTQRKRLRREQLVLWRKRCFTQSPEYAHSFLHDQVAQDWTLVPPNKSEDRRGGLSLCQAYLLPYQRRFDDGFRRSMQAFRFEVGDASNPVLSDSILDSFLWDTSGDLPNPQAVAQTELINRDGYIGLKKQKLATLQAKKVPRPPQEYLYFGTNR